MMKKNILVTMIFLFSGFFQIAECAAKEISPNPIVNVSMSLTGVDPAKAPDSDAWVHFKVSWFADLKNPLFTLYCISGSAGDTAIFYDIDAKKGTKDVSLKGVSPTTKIVCSATATYTAKLYGSASLIAEIPKVNNKPLVPPAKPNPPPAANPITITEPLVPPALSPVTYIKATFVEKVTSGSALNFSTTADLTANFDQKTLTGNIMGSSGRYVEFKCYDNNKTVIDYATVGYSFSYVSFANGKLDPATGAFSAVIEPVGKVTGILTSPFRKANCTHMNNDPIPGLSPFNGRGTISGVIKRSGSSSVVTKWTAGKASVTGNWNGI